MIQKINRCILSEGFENPKKNPDYSKQFLNIIESAFLQVVKKHSIQLVAKQLCIPSEVVEISVVALSIIFSRSHGDGS